MYLNIHTFFSQYRVIVKELQNTTELEEISFTEIFKWQERKLGRHEIVKSNENENSGVIYSYTNEDRDNNFEEVSNLFTVNHYELFCFQPLLTTNRMETSKLAVPTSNLNSENFAIIHKDVDDKFLLQKAIANPFPDTNYEVMYIMADMG